MGQVADIKKTNPFLGLRPFTPEECDLFFGRESESEKAFEKLLNNRFLSVIGVSGSGKSSLIHCGILPRVNNFGDKKDEWKVISFKPEVDPFYSLAEAIAGNSNVQSSEDIYRDLTETPDGITEVFRKLISDSSGKILLIIDQFEQLFRYVATNKKTTTQDITAKFIDCIVNLAKQTTVDVFTIITIRSDFIEECSHYQSLMQLINDSNYLIPKMDREKYRDVIVGPINYAGAKIEPELVELILNDIGERTDQLPVLQHTMMRMWSRWKELGASNRPIDKSDYDSVGTISGAMSLHANEAYEELTSRGKEICEVMFKAITEKGADGKSLRRPTSVKNLKEIANCSSDELFEVINKFRATSRSFITPSQNVKLDEDSIIDLSHESLMRLWDRLREWVDEEAASVQMYLRLSEISAMYQQGKTTLLRQPDLQLAIIWRDKNKPTLAWATRYNPAFERAMIYLRTSEKEYLEQEENKIKLQKKQQRKTKIILFIVGVVVVISIAFMLFAFVQKIASDRQTVDAEQRRFLAEREKVRADSSTIEAIAALKIANSNATIAVNNAQEADRQRRLAEQEALRHRKIALEQYDYAKIATEQRDIAQRQRMLSVSKFMALKSLQEQGQKDMQSLLAYQAYLFNKDNGGIDNDADIYAGLYSVAKNYGNKNYKSFEGHTDGIRSIAFVPGKKEFFTSGNDGKVIKWSLDQPNQALQIIYSGSEIIDILTVSPDTSWLAMGGENSAIKMVSLKGEEGYEMKGSGGAIKSLIFSIDSKNLYSASIDGIVLKWDLASHTSVNVTDGTLPITSIDISFNGKFMAGINTAGEAMVWNQENKSDNFRIDMASKNIKSIRFDPDGNILALGDIRGNVELWDVVQRKKISEVKAHNDQVNDIRFNSRLKQMATASNDKSLKIFNVTDITDLTEPPINITDFEGFVMVIQFSPDGNLIISGSYENRKNLVSRPTHVDGLVGEICGIVSRNMTQEEWNIYVGKDIPLEKTCKVREPSIIIRPI